VIEDFLRQDREQKRARIVSETAKISWLELQRFFAAGKVFLIATELDLVDVAYAFQEDEVEIVKSWTDNQQVFAVSDDQAKQWVAAEDTLWAVVIKPWVLVQAIKADS
jgi:hypothetical protein